MVAIGIDVGGQSIRGGAINKDGKVLDKIVVMTEAEKGRTAVIQNIVKVGRLLIEKYPRAKKIGIGILGVVNKKGYVTLTPNIPLSNYDLGKDLTKRFKKKLIFSNDADNFMLAEYYFGFKKKKKNIIGLTLGTGVGSGIILDGKIFSNKGAPELGHTTIDYNSRSFCCGNQGCIESFIGRKSFAIPPLEVYKKAVSGDKIALKKFSNYGKYLGIAIANFINIFNPDVVVLGGQMSNAYNYFKQSMEDQIKKRALFKCPVKKNTIKSAGMVGACLLTVD